MMLAAAAGSAVAAAFSTALPARADITYTTADSSFTLTTQDNFNPPYAGFYTGSGNAYLGVYANGGTGGFASNPQAVGYHYLTSDGSNSSALAVPLRVGQSISITLGLSGSRGINGNSIGFSLNGGADFNSVNAYNSAGRFEYSFTAGDSSAKVYDGTGAQSAGLPGFSDFQAGRTYTFTLISSDEYNFSVAGGATYNVGKLNGSAGAAIQSFALFNRGYNNDDALFSNIVVRDVSALAYTANAGETKTVTGTISNNGSTANSVQKLGAGTVVFAAANTYTGSTAISAGTLKAGVANALPGTTAVTLASGATLDLNGFGQSIGSIAGAGGNVDVSAALSVGSDNTSTTYAGTFTGSAGITKTGSGTLTLVPSSTYSGLWNLNGGAVSVSGLAALGSGTAGAMNFDGGTLRLTGVTQTTNTGGAIGAGGATIDVTLSGTNLTLGAAFTGTGSFTKSGPGTITWGNVTNRYSGGTIINDGKVVITNQFALPVSQDGSTFYKLTMNGGTLDIGGFGRTLSAIELNGGLLDNGAADQTVCLNVNAANGFAVRAGEIDVALGGSANMVKTTAGAVTISNGYSTFSGATSISNGTLLLNASAPQGGTNVTGALGNAITAVTLGDASSASSDNIALLTNGAVTVGRSITVNANNAAGTTKVGGNSAHDSTFSGTLTLNRETQFTAANGGTVTFSGAILGSSGAVTKTGAGTIVLTNTNNSWSGGTTISDGTLRLGQSNTLPGGVTLNTGGTLDINSVSEGIGFLTINGGTIANTGGNPNAIVQSQITIDGRSGVVNARLGNPVGLNKTTAGTLTLNVTNTYTGATSVTGGTLVVNGSLSSSSSAVDVGDGANAGTGTLAGNGTVSRPVNINNGGAISPGDSSIHSLATGALTLAGGGTYVWEIANAATGQDTNYDLIAVTGALTLAAQPEGGPKFRIKVVSSQAVAGFNPLQPYTWTIATASGGISGFDASKFVLDVSDFSDDNAMAGGAFAVAQNGGQLQLQFTVPEPSAGLLLPGLAAVALVRKRRRRPRPKLTPNLS
jgi:autotransporter-associated beta strand protein